MDPAVLARIIGTAFEPLEPCKYLVPDQGARLAYMTRFFKLDVDDAREHGIVEVTGDHKGVALWFPRTGQAPAPPDAEALRALQAATGPYAPRFAEFERILEEHHPGGRAHQYLMILGVDRPAQRTGRGSALLAHRHAALDRDGVPAYLEAASLALTSFYARHGYVRTGREIVLPDNRRMFPMWREPQSPAGAP